MALVAVSTLLGLQLLRTGSPVSPSGGEAGPGVAVELPAGGDGVRFTALAEEMEGAYGPAIRDALEALAADPGSSLAPTLLEGMYESKLQVLQTAVRLARST